MWTLRKDCAVCGEEKKFHYERGECRFKQPGWTDAVKQPPDMRVKVLARRNKEVFVAMRKIDVMSMRNEDRVMWVIPYKRDGEIYHGIVEGVTHWRPLRSRDVRIEKQGRLTSRHHAAQYA